MLNFRLINVIKSTAVYRGYKMLAFMFHLAPQVSVLSINGVDLNLIYEGIYLFDYTTWVNGSTQRPFLNMQKIYEELGGRLYTYYIGKIDISDWVPSPTYEKWYYLMCLVDDNGIAVPAYNSRKGLSNTITIGIDESLLTGNEPTIPECVMFGLPIKGNCTNFYQTGYPVLNVSN